MLQYVALCYRSLDDQFYIMTRILLLENRLNQGMSICMYHIMWHDGQLTIANVMLVANLLAGLSVSWPSIIYTFLDGLISIN